jgi:hypothetical protein
MKGWTLVTQPPRGRDEAPESRPPHPGNPARNVERGPANDAGCSRDSGNAGRSAGLSGVGHLLGEIAIASRHLLSERASIALVLMLMVLLLVCFVSPAVAGWTANPAGADRTWSAHATAGPRAGQDATRALGVSAELSAPQMVTITFQQGISPTAGYSGVADTYIKNADATNYGRALELRMAYDTREQILLRFDLAGQIPQQAVVTEARLELFAFYSEYPSVNTDVGIYEVLRPWTESGATWIRATADTSWQQAGCAGATDRSSEYSAVARFSTALAWQVWHNTPFTDLVQRWVSDPAHNYGVILLSLPAQARQFWVLYSSQIGVELGPRPRLNVSYYVPVSTPTPTASPTRSSTPTVTRSPTPTIPAMTPTPTHIITTALVSGVAWRDENANRQRDLGEPPMAGITVVLRDSARVELGRRVTAADGSYEFTNLAQGSYLLTKEDPVGYGSTWPTSGTYAFTLVAGQQLTGMDFGFALLVTATPTVPTRTPTPTATTVTAPTRTPTPTATTVIAPTWTPTPTATTVTAPTRTPTPTATTTTASTWTLTPTATRTATPTVTSPSTSTNVATVTITLTPLATETPTSTPSSVPTITPTVTRTPMGAPVGNLEDPIPIGCGEIRNGSTAGYASVINDYGACGVGMWGPEIVYSFHASYALDWLSISLDTPADLSLFVLSSASPAACFASGGSVVLPGIGQGVTYYIVVDGSESANYTMEVYCYPPPGTTPTFTPTRTATATVGPSPTPTKTRTPGGPSRIYLPIVYKPGIEYLVDCGAAADYLDGTGQLWLADRAYTAGGWGYVGYSDTWSTSQDVVVDTPGLMRLYQTVRFGDAFGYQFDVPNGEYEVELHFAEVFHTAEGQRVFDVILEGQTKLDDYDIFVAAGGKLRSDVESFAVTVSDGQLDLILDAKVDLAMINAIRVTKQ